MRELETDPDAEGWEQSVEFLESNPGLLKQIREAASKKHLGMPRSALSSDDVDSESGPPAIGILLPQLSVMHRCRKVLEVDAMIAMQERDIDRVLFNLDSVVGLQQQTPVVGALLERLVQISMASVVNGLVLKNRLELGLWNEEQLHELLKIVSDTDIQGGLTESLHFERWTCHDMIEWIFVDSIDGRLSIRGAKRFLNLIDMLESPENNKLFTHRLEGDDVAQRARALQIVVKPKQDQQRLIQELFDLIEADYRSPAHLLKDFSASQKFDSMISTPSMDFGYSPVLVCIPDLSRAYRRQVSMDAELNAAKLVVRLAMHYSELGEYPEMLQELGRFTDPYSGESLGYKLIDGNPMIYSVDPDRDDDGGRVLVDDEGGRVWWPEFIPLDDLKGMSDEELEAIDGDWVLYPYTE